MRDMCHVFAYTHILSQHMLQYYKIIRYTVLLLCRAFATKMHYHSTVAIKVLSQLIILDSHNRDVERMISITHNLPWRLRT